MPTNEEPTNPVQDFVVRTYRVRLQVRLSAWSGAERAEQSIQAEFVPRWNIVT